MNDFTQKQKSSITSIYTKKKRFATKVVGFCVCSVVGGLIGLILIMFFFFALGSKVVASSHTWFGSSKPNSHNHGKHILIEAKALRWVYILIYMFCCTYYNIWPTPYFGVAACAENSRGVCQKLCTHLRSLSHKRHQSVVGLSDIDSVRRSPGSLSSSRMRRMMGRRLFLVKRKGGGVGC